MDEICGSHSTRSFLEPPADGSLADAIASTRFGLEALRPALEMELEKPLRSAELEEAVRQR